MRMFRPILVAGVLASAVAALAVTAGCSGGIPGLAANPADSGGLTIAAGKKYHYKYTPEVMGYIDIEILNYSGDAVTYNGRTVLFNRPVQTDTAKTITRQNGVFWPSNDPNPATKDINSYALEPVTVKAGTFQCRVIPSDNGATKHWFAGPMLVKIANPLVSMELVSID